MEYLNALLTYVVLGAYFAVLLITQGPRGQKGMVGDQGDPGLHGMIGPPGLPGPPVCITCVAQSVYHMLVCCARSFRCFCHW